ncbi:DMT family transporter [Kitasatospora sp. NBC_00315]|uniref:DMT family transporter n=1 Tax=Kitasatospora sp. NBC_00315 TaxID=2975963 RepID=UPI003253B82A
MVAVVWGSSFFAVNRIADSHTVLAMLVLRFGLVLPVLGFAARRALRGLGWREWAGGAALGLILGAVFLLETYGSVSTSVTNAGLIISLTMVITPLAESAITRTRLPRAFALAAVLSVLGVALLTGERGFQALNLGDLLVFGAAVARTVNVLAMSRTRAIRRTDPLALTWIQLAGATVVFAIGAACTGSSPWALARSFGPVQWALLLHLALLCTLFAFFVQLWAVRATSPSRVSLLLGTEPVWAAVFGIGIAGERPGLLGLFGVLLILAGTEWGRRSTAPAAAAAAAVAAASAGPPEVRPVAAGAATGT